MSLIINAISAIGNNNSFYPLLVRDCGIEAPTKVAQTYNQNAKESAIMAKHATRERIIDEYGASAIWLGGIPVVEQICNKIINKCGFSSKINYKLLDPNKNAMSDIDRAQQSADINIEKFGKNKSKDVMDAVADLKKARSNNGLLRKLTVGKYTAAIAVPVALMGFILPKTNFAITNYLFKKDAQKGLIPEKYLKDKGYGNDVIAKFSKNKDGGSNVCLTSDDRFSALNAMRNKNPLPSLRDTLPQGRDVRKNFSGASGMLTKGMSKQVTRSTGEGLVERVSPSFKGFASENISPRPLGRGVRGEGAPAFTGFASENISPRPLGRGVRGEGAPSFKGFASENISPRPSGRGVRGEGVPSFTGFASFMTGLTQQQKMAMTDGGLGLGRVSTSRRKNEAIENGVRVAGMMYLNFVAPKQIDKGLDKVITKVFGINPSLDPKIMANKRFLAAVRADKLDLPDSQKEVIEFIDNNPKSLFVKLARQKGEVSMLKSGVRDPRCYVDTEKVFGLAEQMREFGESARESGNVVKYARKALGAKSASILVNIALSSSLLAVALPQAQFALRKLLFKSDVDPGLV